MGLIKEYEDRAVQTDVDTDPSPYADPAVVLAAPHATRNGPQCHNLTSASSPTGSDSAYAVLQGSTSPMLATLSRRLSKRTRKPSRCPAGEIVDRRIVSMPENKSEVLSHSHGKRIVSMPDRIRPALDPSVELFQSPSMVAGDSFGSYGGHHERVSVFRAPSDVPQTPSPPSSPESLLIIAAGTQLSDGFLRRRYSPELLIEEDEAAQIVPDWVTWANSPPRPIPALHGPLSLPYARCPSGAEGTIIEEPDNVAQMIWGLGPDDQPHNQVRAEGRSPCPDNSQNAPSHIPGQVPPRLQKKRTSTTQQIPKSSRTQVFTHTGHANQSIARPQRQVYDDRRSPLSQVSPDIEIHQDTVSGLPWNEGQSMSTNVGVPDKFANDADVFPVDDNRVLEWQLARLRHALRTSLADMDSYTAYPGRLEPVIPATVTPGIPQSYPRIFVEPRLNESVGSAARQSSIEIAQQYRQQQLYKQALQKQKLQIQSLLPTPPNSSSPRWSSHFSPYLTYCSTFSPESVGSSEHLAHLSPQKYGPSTNASQCLRHTYDRHERDDVPDFDTVTNVSLAKAPQIVSNANSAPSFSSSSSNTLAKYIKQLQALSPIAPFPSLQSVPPSVSLPSLPPTDEGTGPFRTAYQSPTVPTPPSPESPRTVSRRSSYHSARPMTRPVQRRLSSVPEEDNVELSTSISPARLQNQVTISSISSSHDGTTGHQTRFVDVMRKSAVPDLRELEGNLGPSAIAFHETSPVKVRLPVTKERYLREQISGYREQNKEEHPQGHKKKHKHKKHKGAAAMNEQATTHGLVG